MAVRVLLEVNWCEVQEVMPRGGWKKNKNGLTDQQQQFVDYRRTHPEESDGSCYMRFYKVKSKKTAAVNACNLLKNPNVVRYLSEKQLQAEEKADYDQEQWVRDLVELKNICMAKQDFKLIAETVGEDGKVKRVELMQRRFDSSGANKALDTLGKFKKWLAPDATPGGNNPGVTVTNGVIFVGADGFGGVVGGDGQYLEQPKRKGDDDE